ncbi:hypothetical protein [Kitasatospora arboriphila]|uniref:Holin n=1 Tax=Kitasatospora arboriphila TaxID=258052 RepID=A0ABN1TXR3_9ACTN
MPKSDPAPRTSASAPGWLRTAQIMAGALTAVTGTASIALLAVGTDMPADAWVALFGASGTLWVGLLSVNRRVAP